MNEEVELEEHDLEAAASEQAAGESQDNSNENQKMVPLAAVLATRKKLQEAESRLQKAEAEKEYVLRMHAQQQSQPVEESDEDPKALIERKDLKESNAQTKREILETLYQDMNPEAVQKIDKYLKSILERKPWLASSIDTAQNRYARAYEIVQDYIHLVEEKPAVKQPNSVTDVQRMVQNSQKPRSPVEVGKSARPQGVEYLKSIQGKKEFREYRQKLLRGES